MADYSDAIQFLVGTFKLPADIFTWPNVVFHLIIPMIASVAIWYTLLHRGLKIIHHSGVNFGLAIIFSIFMIPFVYIIPTQIFILVAAEIFILMGGITSWKKIVAAVIVGVVIIWGYPYLVTLLESGLNY